jgi:hypothetical protein
MSRNEAIVPLANLSDKHNVKVQQGTGSVAPGSVYSY